MSGWAIILTVLAICSPMLITGAAVIRRDWTRPERQRPERFVLSSPKPYYDPAACWGCGLYEPETEAQREAKFRHPLFRRVPILCRYCRELEELTEHART